MLMVRIATISVSVNQRRHLQRLALYPAGLTGGVLHFSKMVVANAVDGNVVSSIVVEIVDMVTVVEFAVMLNDIVAGITAMANCLVLVVFWLKYGGAFSAFLRAKIAGIMDFGGRSTEELFLLFRAVKSWYDGH